MTYVWHRAARNDHRWPQARTLFFKNDTMYCTGRHQSLFDAFWCKEHKEQPWISHHSFTVQLSATWEIHGDSIVLFVEWMKRREAHVAWGLHNRAQPVPPQRCGIGWHWIHWSGTSRVANVDSKENKNNIERKWANRIERGLVWGGLGWMYSWHLIAISQRKIALHRIKLLACRWSGPHMCHSWTEPKDAKGWLRRLR